MSKYFCGRHFWSLAALVVLVVFGAQRPAMGQSDAGFSLGVAAGDVTDSVAVLWTRADREGELRVEVSGDASFGSLAFAVTADATLATDLTVKVRATGLTPSANYWYRFVSLSDGAMSRVGRFRTAPPIGEPAAMRFVFSGDTNFAYAPFVLMSQAAHEDADFFLWFGDTIYADVPAGGLGVARTLEEYRAKYRQVRSDPHARELLAAMALWAGWDDHEYGNDYSGTDPAVSREQLRAAYQAFFEYMPIAEPDDPGDPYRTYRTLRWGRDVEMILIDARQYRDPSAESACAGALDPFGVLLGGVLADPACVNVLAQPRSMLGATQLGWLRARLLDSSTSFKLVVNNVPMSVLALLPYDRWDGYDLERRELLQTVDQSGAGRVVFLTTDIHANGFNPDLTRIFRTFRPDYGLTGATPVSEIIVGPLGNETAQQSVDLLLESVPAGFSRIAQLAAGVLERRFLQRVQRANGLAFIEPDRVSYAVVSLSAGGTLDVTYRGLPPETARDPAASAETIYPQQQVAAGVPCFLPLGLVLALFTISPALRRRR